MCCHTAKEWLRVAQVNAHTFPTYKIHLTRAQPLSTPGLLNSIFDCQLKQSVSVCQIYIVLCTLYSRLHIQSYKKPVKFLLYLDI